MHLLIICLQFSSQTNNKWLSLFNAKRKKSFTLGQQPHSNSCCNCILLILIIHGIHMVKTHFKKKKKTLQERKTAFIPCWILKTNKLNSYYIAHIKNSSKTGLFPMHSFCISKEKGPQSFCIPCLRCKCYHSPVKRQQNTSRGLHQDYK